MSAASDRAPGHGKAPRRTLIGGVGYRFLRDFSVGVVLADRLASEPWPSSVSVEDLGYGPVAVGQRLQEAEPPFDRLVLMGAARRGHAPGTLSVYVWDGSLPPADDIQARVAEAVTGVLDLDNLVVVLGALGGAPREIVVVEIEPGVEAHGEELSPEVARGAHQAELMIREIVGSVSRLEMPEAPLGGMPARVMPT